MYIVHQAVAVDVDEVAVNELFLIGLIVAAKTDGQSVSWISEPAAAGIDVGSIVGSGVVVRAYPVWQSIAVDIDKLTPFRYRKRHVVVNDARESIVRICHPTATGIQIGHGPVIGTITLPITGNEIDESVAINVDELAAIERPIQPVASDGIGDMVVQVPFPAVLRA